MKECLTFCLYIYLTDKKSFPPKKKYKKSGEIDVVSVLITLLPKIDNLFLLLFLKKTQNRDFIFC